MQQTVSLDDKYTLRRGRIFVTGIQALVRLPLEQILRDRAAGLDTAGYITGYRGSPLGAYDQQLALAGRHLDAAGVVHQPAVNEDLAATACQGTQQVGLVRKGKCDGVFAIWYGKGPGVDRSGDAVRHGNLFGSSRLGGVLMLLGDDHICESSTTAHQSEYAMVDALVPVLNPAGVQEILEYGILGIAMSRFTGGWSALKCVHDTVECTASIEVGPDLPAIVMPDESELAAEPRNIDLDTRIPLSLVANRLERRLQTTKIEAAQAFARANRIDRVVMGDEHARLGVITCGKSYLDLVAALDLLGIDDTRARALGLRVYKVGMVFPLEPVMLERAVDSLEKVVVIEEKRGLVESQAKELLYGGPVRPVIVGKKDEMGAPLFPPYGAVDAGMIAVALAERLLALGEDAELRARMQAVMEARAAHAGFEPAMLRLPWFCPGCPHNTSTRLPEGSQAMAGIGCHTMVTWMDRDTFGFTQMGAEGASWCGEAPFSATDHLFQNIGDGTFFHSGSLAVRAAVASGVNITYKLLHNDAVALTGGQKMETDNLTVPQICRLLEAEGVREIVVVTDEPARHSLSAGFRRGVRIEHRDELDAVQRRLRAVEGVSFLIYDQTCAAEKRRRRKHGSMADPDHRVFVNELVCEGCGDCGVQSNCVAIQPVETEFGRKRRIDQSACNKDHSCLKGFCPSFVTVHGARLKKPGARPVASLEDLPEPELPPLERPFGILITGVGGRGVVTIGALLGMAAHLDGKGVAGLDMIGLAQKGGAVVSHLRLAPTPAETGAPRLASGGADLVLGCDIVVAAGRTSIPHMARGKTVVVLDTDESMTGAFTADPDVNFPADRLRADIEAAVGADAVRAVQATKLAKELLGDSIGANLFMVGYAWQLGRLPLTEAAILEAIDINGVAVEMNRQAFYWGRRHAALDLHVALASAGPAEVTELPGLDAIVDRRAEILCLYQDEAYAQRYRTAVGRMRDAERRCGADGVALTTAVAHGLFRLMAIKDEYEVARLYSDGSFERRLREELESWDHLELHLAPPFFASRDARTGRLLKGRYGPWILRLLPLVAAMRRYRGTWLDLFGRTAERRRERRLLAEYETMLATISGDLREENYATAITLAGLAREVRGFGHVKEASIERYEKRRAALLEKFRSARRANKVAA